MSKMFDLDSTFPQWIPSLTAKQQYEKLMLRCFEIFSLSLIGIHKVFKCPYILLTGPSQHIQEINQQLYVTINHFFHMAVADNQEQKETYMFKYMLSQPEQFNFVKSMLK